VGYLIDPPYIIRSKKSTTFLSRKSLNKSTLFQKLGYNDLIKTNTGIRKMTLLAIIKKAATFAVTGDDEALNKIIETSEDLLLQPEEKHMMTSILNHLGELRDRIFELECYADDIEN
jgi:hypothetical protein